MEEKRKPVRRLAAKEAEALAITIAKTHLESHPHHQWHSACTGVSTVVTNKALRTVIVEWTNGDTSMDGPGALIVNLETGDVEGWV